MKLAGAYVRIGDICELHNGRAFKPEEWCDDGLPIVRIQNLNDESKPFNYFDGELSSNHEVNTGDLLFSWSGTPGTSFGAFFWNRGRGVLNQHIFNVRYDRRRVDGGYFRYAINNSLARIIGQAHGGVGLKHITKGKFESVEIPLPPLPEQKRIAAILDQAEALRAKRRAAIKLLDELTQSIFLDMFGDPVKNADWPWQSLEQLSDLVTKGESPKWQGFEYQDDGAIFVTSENVRDGFIDLSHPKFVPLEFDKKLHRSRLAKDDLLINLVGASIGRSCIYPGHHKPANVNQAVAVVRLKPEVISVEYVAAFMRTREGQKALTGNIVEAARANVSLANVRKLPIRVPPSELQNEFSDRLYSLSDASRLNKSSLFQLDNLFASLQHRAFRGEL